MMPPINPLNRKGQNNLGTTEEQNWISRNHTLFKKLFKWHIPLPFQLQATDTFVSLCKCQTKKDKAVCISFFSKYSSP